MERLSIVRSQLPTTIKIDDPDSEYHYEVLIAESRGDLLTWIRKLDKRGMPIVVSEYTEVKFE